ncbi:uncharacterized protein LOC121995357 [Zingiber officinale]|uniref:uncharacterized protein LOC121995357 n=1 Tax=Zingiber officinale TaxID=94328 RepID=UPI001C4D481C|nr:uncharacterized protein LOC121995357 [Zingiber officinale]
MVSGMSATTEAWRRRKGRRRQMANGNSEASLAVLAASPTDEAAAGAVWRRKKKVDATGKKGLSPLQKCTAVTRQLAYGVPTDHYDEYLRIAETTAIQCLFSFCRCVIEVFGAQYLRRPNAADIQHLLKMHEQRYDFPGMLGSLDCMHWQWKNCPVAWKGQFTRGDHGIPTIVLEAVASSDLWICHVFFGIAGSRYYLTDGIYPEWATFVKSVPCPQDLKRKIFKERQEAARKDVERAFGVLQSQWAMIRGPRRFWYKDNLKDIMYIYVILHNMIIENEGDAISTKEFSVDSNHDGGPYTGDELLFDPL